MLLPLQVTPFLLGGALSAFCIEGRRSEVLDFFSSHAPTSYEFKGWRSVVSSSDGNVGGGAGLVQAASRAVEAAAW